MKNFRFSCQLLFALFLGCAFVACSGDAGKATASKTALPQNKGDAPKTTSVQDAAAQPVATSSASQADNFPDEDHRPNTQNIREIFLSLEDEYLMVHHGDVAKFPSEKRMELLAGKTEWKGAIWKLRTLDEKNAFLSYAHETEEGTWTTEITYFRTSAGEKLVGLNHVVEGRLHYSAAVYFLLPMEKFWYERQNAALPRYELSDFYAEADIKGKEDKIRKAYPGSLSTWDKMAPFVLCTLPQKGKTVQVLPGRIKDPSIGKLPPFTTPKQLLWQDGIFAEDMLTLKAYLALPRTAFSSVNGVGERNELLPAQNDNAPDRKKLISANHSHRNVLRLGLFPGIYTGESTVEVGYYEAQGLVGVYGDCYLPCPPSLTIYRQGPKGMTDVTKDVLTLPGKEVLQAAATRFKAAGEDLGALDPDLLVYRFRPHENKLLVVYEPEMVTGDEDMVVATYVWENSRFVEVD